MSRYGESLGVWELKVGGANLELRPQMGDNRRFRAIVMDDAIRKNKPIMFNKFEDYMVSLIKRDEPPTTDEEEKELLMYVEYNINELFEETMVKFRWTTREELEKGKRDSVKEIKKLTEES